MQQSTFIAGALLGGFLLYLAAQNRLSAYAAVLWGPTAAPASGGGGSSSGGLNIGDAAAIAEHVLPMVLA